MPAAARRSVCALTWCGACAVCQRGAARKLQMHELGIKMPLVHNQHLVCVASAPVLVMSGWVGGCSHRCSAVRLVGQMSARRLRERLIICRVVAPLTHRANVWCSLAWNIYSLRRVRWQAKSSLLFSHAAPAAQKITFSLATPCTPCRLTLQSLWREGLFVKLWEFRSPVVDQWG